MESRRPFVDSDREIIIFLETGQMPPVEVGQGQGVEFTVHPKLEGRQFIPAESEPPRQTVRGHFLGRSPERLLR